MKKRLNFGWVRDLPDFRDFDDKNVEIKKLLRKNKAFSKEVSRKVDLRQWCSPVEHQGEIGSCTANAVAAVVEYFQRKTFGKHVDASRLFLYKVTRNLMHCKGDTGAYLRTAMKALALFGVSPEEHWPYFEEKFDEEPPAFCYAFAQNFQAIKYLRLDGGGITGKDLLQKVKQHLSSQIPAVFGFSVFSSLHEAQGGRIPFPGENEKLEGGHAVTAVGFDDSIEIPHPNNPKQKTKGAILLRNSWGEEWGEKGYGWLPYRYILQGLAIDWWVLLKSEWIDTSVFK